MTYKTINLDMWYLNRAKQALADADAAALAYAAGPDDDGSTDRESRARNARLLALSYCAALVERIEMDLAAQQREESAHA